MPELELTKGSVHYEVHGPASAPWAVVLPGAAIAGWMYEPLVAQLSQEFRVLTFEYRGLGLSRNELWGPSPGLLAEDTLKLFDHLGILRAHAVGFSLGTFVMAEMLARQPERLDRCAIGCMPVVRGRWDPPEGLHDGILPADMREAMTWNRLSHIILPFFFSKWFQETHPEAYKKALVRASSQTSREMLTAMQQLNGVLSYDYHGLQVYERLPRGRRLFLVGETDAMTRPANLREHPITREGPTIVFRHSGHVFLYEQPAAVAAVVARFWRDGIVEAPLEMRAAAVPLEALP